MLTRRHIRIKVVQSAYAFSLVDQGKVQEQLSFFKKSILDSVDLLILQLALFKALKHQLVKESESHQNKYIKHTESALSPDSLLNNKYFDFIAEHPVLLKKSSSSELNNWEIEFKLVERLWDEIQKDDDFVAYCNISEPDTALQREIIIKIFKNKIASASYLHQFYEDQKLTWLDDLPVINTFILKSLKQIDPKNSHSLVLPDGSEWSEELYFGNALLEKFLTNEEALEKELEGKTPNWDPDRIAHMDRLLLKIAIAELLYFPEIPPKVTLNEFLEIAKEYSTPKSNSFINGVLDKLVKEFADKNRLNKTGRGLL